jgi:4-aminobutyrate aminotransferase/(S)-3-amino-2-methylpropionate transaminase
VALGRRSGGLPLSACVGRAEVMRRWPASHGEALHTSTHLGNPVTCAAGVAVLGVIERDALVRRSADVGARFLAGLQKRLASSARVRDVRGRGLLVAVELDSTPLARALVGELLRSGWITLGEGPDGRTLAFTPPLTIAEPLLDAATERLAELLQ